VAALVAGLVGCAHEPVAGWSPPEPDAGPGLVLLAEADAAGAGDENGAGEQGGTPLAPVNGEAASVDVPGLVGGRLRNDALPFAARFVYIPGVPAFNDRVDAFLWVAIKATGKRYGPQVHATSAKLSDRGCVPGSTSWPATDVLGRAETGPTGGTGTAVTCEVIAAFGKTVVVVVRVVTGSPEKASSDRLHTLVADLAAGTVTESNSRWSDEAPAEFWAQAMELLRQRAGGLSRAPISPPDEAQLKVARAALDAAVHVDADGEGSGALRVSIPAEHLAPELAGLIPPPAGGEPQAFAFRVDPATVREWSSAQQRALLDSAGTPFAGVGTAPVDIDCALIPCIALTYDDGPGPYTGKLLDTLKSKHARATFFMIGNSAAGNTAMVRRAHAEGHEIGSHTMTHADLTKLSLAAARAQVLDAAGILKRATGAPVTLYRPPYGAVNQAVMNEVGMPTILWAIDTNDWREPGAAALVERGVDWPTAGDIVLFHDTHADSVDVAGKVIDGLRNRGFEPVTVTELFGGDVPMGRVSGR